MSKFTHQNEQYQFGSLDEAVLAKVDNGEACVDDMLIINHGDKEIRVRVIGEGGDYVVLDAETAK